MNTIDDAEIHQIVQRVLKQVLGQSQPAAAPVTPAPPAETVPAQGATGPGEESGRDRVGSWRL